MNSTARYALFFIVVLLANIMQTITGFAGTVLAMPFSIILIGGEEARLILNILGIAASLGVVLLNFKAINWKEVLKICIVMAAGMAIGFIIIHYADVSKQILYFILAGFVLLFTIIGIYTTFFKKEKELAEGEVDKYAKVKEVMLYVILVVAGVVHGMFVCGGPLLIIYATKKLKDRDEFRSTLSMVWIVLNTVNLVRDIIAGAFTAENVGHLMIVLAISLAVLIVAIFAGNVVAKKLNKKAFMLITYILMVISAVSLILNACGIF